MKRRSPSSTPITERGVRNAFATPAFRYFCDVALTGSFRGAGEKSNIAASAIHRQVSLLEDQIGVALLERRRGRSGVRLTSAGEILYRRASRAIGELSRGLTEIDDLRGRHGGKVVVGTSDTLARDVLVEICSEIFKKNPDIALDIKVHPPHQLVEMLISNRLDVALSYDVASQMGVEIIDSFALPTSVIVPKGHDLASKESVSLMECARYPIALADDMIALEAMLAEMASDQESLFAPRLKTNSYVLMRDIVARGLAISFQTALPKRFAADVAAIVYVPLRQSVANYGVLSCYMKEGHELSPSASWFVDWLVRSLREELTDR